MLIAEYEVPTVGAPAKLVLQDLNMMAIGGMEPTEKQWAELLDQVGQRWSRFGEIRSAISLWLKGD